MTKASDNAFPSLLITEGTEPSAPAAGKQRLYIDSTTHHLMRTNSSGVEVDLEPSGSGEALSNLFVGVGHPMLASSIGTALAANRAYLCKYTPMVDVTVTTLNIYINTSSGNLDGGIYDATFSSRLASTGSFGSPGTGLRTQAFSGAASVVLDAGTIYYLAFACSNTTFRCPTYVPPGAQTTGYNILGREDSAFPLPTSIASVDAWEDGFTFPMFYFT